MADIRTFADAHEALKVFIPPFRTTQSAYTLERMKRLMKYLGNPQEQYPVVHIAGTSGKSSTAYYIRAMLAAGGAKTGLTVSPYVDAINERIQVDGSPLPEKDFCNYLQEFLDTISDFDDKPLYFEVLIAFAYWVFAKEAVDYAVVEVGMGGLLDPTNIVTGAHKVCVITDIGLDHTDILGKEVSEIAAQKAGIVQPHNPVFMYDQGNEIMSVVREVSGQMQAELHEIIPADPRELPPSLPLFQKRNWYLAYNVLQYLATTNSSINLAEQQLADTVHVYIPGRMEILSFGDKTIVLDGAHNDQKLEALFASVKRRFPGKDYAVLLAMAQRNGSRTKSNVDIVMSNAAYGIFSAQPSSAASPKQAVNPIKLAEHAHKLGYDNWELAEDLTQACKVLLHRKEPVLIVTGSFYIIHQVREYIKQIKI